MAKYTPNFGLYMPEINDPNTVYTLGFARNFETVDTLLAGVTGSEVTDPLGGGNREPGIIDDDVTKRFIYDIQAAIWQGHRNVITGAKKEDFVAVKPIGPTFEKEILTVQNNPHGVSAEWITDYADMDGRANTIHPVDGGDPYPSTNRGHNAIVKVINNRVTTTGTNAVNRDEEIFGHGETAKDGGKTGAGGVDNNPRQGLLPSIDFTELYLDDIGGGTADIGATPLAIADKYRAHDALGITENRVADVIANGSNSSLSTDTDDKRHLSGKTIYELEGHRRNVGEMDEDPLYDDTNWSNGEHGGLNPHRVRAEDLLDKEYTTGNGNGVKGRAAIIREVNRTLAGNASNPQTGKIFWDIIDKDDVDGAGGKADIQDIPLRDHDNLQNISIADPTSTDSTAIRHVTDAQTKEWTDHMNVTPADGENPHFTKASQLWNVAGTKGGDSSDTSGARAAILETLNANNEDDNLNWTEIDTGGSNITDITTRLHDNLQNPYETTYLHPDSSFHSDKRKNKHVSIAEIYSLVRASLVNDNENTYRLKSTELISNLGLVEAYNQNFGGGASSGDATVSADLSSLPNDNDIFLTITLGDAEGNVGLFFNDYYLGSASGPNGASVGYEYIIPSRYVINGTNTITVNWREASYSGDDTGSWTETNIVQYTERHGGLAIVDAINQLVDTVDSDLIQWDKLSKVGANITDIPTRLHSDLQSIGELNENDSNTVKDKHLSNAQAKVWHDHVNLTLGQNPHGTQAFTLRGHNYGADGDFSSVTGADALTTEININGQTNAINWNKVSKTNSNLTELSIRNHDDLQARGEADSNSTNTTRNKHVSNAQTKKWEDHANSKADLTIRDQNNPHLLQADGLYTHRGDGTRGGNAIAHAINDYGSTGAIFWDKINFQTGSTGDGFSIPDIINPNDRLHASLGGIREVDVANSGASNADGHITDSQANIWHVHTGGNGDAPNVNNPHLVQAAQLTSNVGGTSNGGNAIIVEVNQPTTTQRITHTKVNWQDFSIDLIGKDSNGTDVNLINRSHDRLYFEATNAVNPADSNTTNRGHVTNSQAKKWEDHADSTGNSHSMFGDQLPLRDTTGSSIVSTDVENAIYEIDNFRNRPNSGPVSVGATVPSGTRDYYFDKTSSVAWHLHVPVTDTYINSEEQFAGKTMSYMTPTNGTHPTHGYDSFRFDFSVLPKDRQFYIVASESAGVVSVNITTDIGSITDGKVVTILLAHIRTNSVGSPVEAYSFSTNQYGLGLIEKTYSRLVLAEPYRRQTGMFLRDTVGVADLTFFATAGTVWRGIDIMSLSQISSTDPGKVSLVYRDGAGEFVYTDRTSAVFNQYQNPAGGLTNLAATEHVANMIYYDLVYDRLYIMLSERPVIDIDDFNRSGDEIFPSVLPEHISATSLLIGVLLERMPAGGEPNPPEQHEVIYSAFDTVFTNTTTGGSSNQHNILPDLDTGTQYLHVTSTEKTKLSLIEAEANKTTNATVDSHIVNILNGNGVDASLNTITKIANKTKSNEDNKLSRIADDYTTGRLRIFKNNPAVGIPDFAVTGDNNTVKTFIGNSSSATSNVAVGFWQVYKGSESSNNNAFEFWSDNLIGSGDYDRGNLVYRITQDGLAKWYTELQMYEHIHVYQNATNTNHFDVYPGLAPLENISIDQSGANTTHSAYGVIFGEGTSDEQGSILLRHNGPNFGTVLRARNEKFEIDTYGGLFINTDITRPESLTQPDPGNPQGLKYIDTGSNAISTVYVGYDATNPSNPSEPHPIILEPTRGKSLIKGGLHIGTGSYTLNDAYMLSISGGNVNFTSGTLDNVGTITFDNGYELSDISATEFFLNADGSSNTVSFGYSNSSVVDLIVDSAGARFQTAAGVKLLDFNSSTGSQIMFHQDIEKFRTSSTGITVNGNVLIDDGAGLSTSMDFEDHSSGFKLRAVEDGTTYYVPMNTDVTADYIRKDISDTSSGDLTILKSAPNLILENNSSSDTSNSRIEFKNTANQNLQVFHEIRDAITLGAVNGQALIVKDIGNGAIAGMEVQGEIYSQGNRVWHSGDTIDSQTLDGIDSASFLRSDVADTASALITFSAGINTSALVVTGNSSGGGIVFPSGSSDSVSIRTTISGASTHLDFNLSDDINGNDKYRWRFDPSGGTEYSLMELYQGNTSASGNARLVLNGRIGIGTTLQPSIHLAVNDDNTGLNSIAAGNLEVRTNNIVRATFDTNGILTPSGQKLSFSSHNSTWLRYSTYFEMYSNVGIDIHADQNDAGTGVTQPLLLRHQSTEIMRITKTNGIEAKKPIKIEDGVTLTYNTTTSSLDFIF